MRDHLGVSDDWLKFELADFRLFRTQPSKSGDDGSSKKPVSFDKIFKKGKLESKFFRCDSKLDSNDRIYCNKNGVLYFDVDGSGREKGIPIVQLKPGDAFSRSHFIFI